MQKASLLQDTLLLEIEGYGFGYGETYIPCSVAKKLAHVFATTSRSLVGRPMLQSSTRDTAPWATVKKSPSAATLKIYSTAQPPQATASRKTKTSNTPRTRDLAKGSWTLTATGAGRAVQADPTDDGHGLGPSVSVRGMMVSLNSKGQLYPAGVW